MRKSLSFAAAAMIGAGALAPSAAAQDMTTATFGGTTIWAGGGVQFLSLPDIRFTGKGSSPTNFRRQKNSDSDWLDFGAATGGGLETALGFWGNHRVTGTVKGFWANVEDSDHTVCRNSSVCVVVDPTGSITGFSPPVQKTRTSREADYWGGQFELKFGRPEPVHEKPNFYRNDYFIIGADVRGIDQDNRLRGGGTPFIYRETLDTTYYGGYIGFGGEYSFGFIPFLGSAVKGVGGIYDRLGLRTFINVTGGLYSAETDYRGTFAFTGIGFKSALSQSNDELAFIGTVSLETRKQIGARTSLSLWTDYEYISSVPQMHYANGLGRPTRIDDDAVFASRTMLRLNIGLGPQGLYPPQ